MKILCSNYLCIYQKKDKCMLDSIGIDMAGVCQECIYPELPSEIVETAKRKLREKYDELDGVTVNWDDQ